MKVALFCGGQGLRIREYSSLVPKPMVMIGPRPALWHVMQYYAYHGHCDFVLCAGYRHEVIGDYVDGTGSAVTDLIEEASGIPGQPLSVEQRAWSIEVVDTGLTTLIGQRLRGVRDRFRGEDYFLANYGDTFTDAPLNDFIEQFKRSGKVAGFLAVRPTYTFHVIDADEQGIVSNIQSVIGSDIWLNGGYFMFSQGIFDYLADGDELVEECFEKLIADRQLMAFRHDGFWRPMDTVKERQELEDRYNAGTAPWALWQHARPREAALSSLVR